MIRKKVMIPDDVKCPDCGSKNLVGRGTDWRVNLKWRIDPINNPPRIVVQLLRCKDCGRIFTDGEKKEVQE